MSNRKQYVQLENTVEKLREFYLYSVVTNYNKYELESFCVIKRTNITVYELRDKELKHFSKNKILLRRYSKSNVVAIGN